MPNPYFKCKQFAIYQDQCAMKVTTDACLFGAWSAVMAATLPKEQHVLDIGTGTGLLSLMYAQQHPAAAIDALEIDENAAIQAAENIAASPWADTIKVISEDLKTYEPSCLYKVIISNPPFYETQLQSPNHIKNIAHHSSQLSLLQLFTYTARLLSDAGMFFVLLPAYRTNETIEIAASVSLFPAVKTGVQQTPNHDTFRTMLLFTKDKKRHTEEDVITIERERGIYSDAFIKLLEPYYLFL